MVTDHHAHVHFRCSLDMDADLLLDIGPHGIFTCLLARRIKIAIEDCCLSLNDICRAVRRSEKAQAQSQQNNNP